MGRFFSTPAAQRVLLICYPIYEVVESIFLGFNKLFKTGMKIYCPTYEAFRIDLNMIY